MAHERSCLMCGKIYSYCSHCHEFDSSETWKYLYHDEKCKQIGHIWYAYRGNEISKEEAKAQLSVLKPNIDDVLKHTSIAANEIREIMAEEPKVIKVKPERKRVVVKKDNDEEVQKTEDK